MFKLHVFRTMNIFQLEFIVYRNLQCYYSMSIYKYIKFSKNKMFAWYEIVQPTIKNFVWKRGPSNAFQIIFHKLVMHVKAFILEIIKSEFLVIVEMFRRYNKIYVTIDEYWCFWLYKDKYVNECKSQWSEPIIDVIT